MQKMNEEFCPDWENAAHMIALLLFMFAVGGEADVEEISTALDCPPHEMVNRSIAWILEIVEGLKPSDN